MAHGIGYDKERLERGESTSNVSVLSRMLETSVTTRYKRNALINKESAEVVTSDS
jgi:hypothetical protein